MADDTSLFNGDEDWNPNLENLVKKEGEQSQSLFWLHNESSKLAALYNDWIQIPGIILASITGFLSATSNIVPPIGIGAMSLLVGILNTVNSYYKFPQIAEAHKITAHLYLKMYKNIRTELALPVRQRANANNLLQNIRDKLARITEIAPQVPNSIINMYKIKFKDATISKPIIANGLDPIDICVSDKTLNCPRSNGASPNNTIPTALISLPVAEKTANPNVIIVETSPFDDVGQESPKPTVSLYPSAIAK